MRKSLSIGGALLALAALISTADARSMGGGMNMPGGMQHGAFSDVRHSPYYYHPLQGGYFTGEQNRTMPPLACRGRPGPGGC